MRRVWSLLLVFTVAVVAIVLWPRSDDAPAKKEIAKATAKRVDKMPRPSTLPLAALEGVVRDDAGKPLAAEVCAYYGDEQRCAKAGADGRYVIEGIVADAVTVTASLARYEPTVAHPTFVPGQRRMLDLTMKAGGTEMTGVVEDMLGGPIAKATVKVNGVRAQTDDQGRFTIWVASLKKRRDVNGWRWLVHASASGYGERSELVNHATNIVIALAPESTITGRVIDERGAAVPNARVIGNIRAGGEVSRTTSDAAGAFTLDRVPMGEIVIEALAPSSYGRHEAVVSIGVGQRVDDVVLRVHAAHTVIATIDVKGDRAICDPRPSLRDWSFDVPDPWRDTQGRYHFDGVPPGTYSVELGCGARISPIVVDGDLEVTWQVDAGGIVKGSVRADRAVNITHTQVELAAVGSRRPPERRDAENGKFELRGIPPGKYTLRAVADRYAFDRDTLGKSEPVTFDIANGQTVEHELVLAVPPHGRVTGRVVDDRGRAVTQGTIDFTREAFPASNYIAQVHDGRYEVDLPIGNYRAWATGRDYRSATSDAIEVRDGGTTTLDITLPREKRDGDEPGRRHELVGRVVDEAGAPVGGAIVTADDFRPEGEESDQRTTSTRTDGSFTLRSRRRTVSVSVYRIGGGRAEETVTAGEPVTIRLERTTTISGVVTRSDGTPASKFYVRDARGERTIEFEHTGGRFVIDVEFPVTLTAGINGLSGDPLTLSAPGPVALKLPPTVTLRGRIVDGATHAPVAGVRVAARQGISDGWAPWFIHPDQVTDSDGRFAMREVPRGQMLLEINPPLDTWSTQSMTIDAATQTDLGEISLSQVRKR